MEKETQLLQNKIAQLEQEIRIEKEISEETQRQIEEDADEEIENLKKVFQENIDTNVTVPRSYGLNMRKHESYVKAQRETKN